MDLLITHVDLDGISPIILMNLTNRKFTYKTIEISEVNDTFDELFKTNLTQYENIYVTDLSLTEHVYEMINNAELKNIKVFDHHETHLFANQYPYVTVKIDIDGIQTCGTELFYNYLSSQYNELNKPNIKDYVDKVRQLDTYHFKDETPKYLDSLKDTYGKKDFIKSITKRLRKEKEQFEFTSFEKRLIKIERESIDRYLQKKDLKMKRYIINNKKCGVVFAETNKSELGNYLSNKYPELDLIILLDASSRISYRTSRDDVSVSEFASIYGGGGHKKASGSSFDDTNREEIIKMYFKDIKSLDTEKI